ncbi:MAG TPA: radical SAM protein, partial [Candidatus Nanopelagicales bacterium]|nr:radical SAM protein [Candidatus Nanopelagicales bacterium]
MKALIKVGYACNENCTFCHTADLREMNDSAERVAWKIDRAKRLGYAMVVLSGGEPTIRPELLAWARRVAAHGLDFGLVTNGLLLSYPHVVDELVERCRLRYVYMSIHGGEAKVHGSVVRADTFHKALGALHLLAGRVPDLTANCVVTTANVRHLRGLVDRLLPLPDLCLKFSMTQPKGAADKAYDVLAPPVEACAVAVKDAIAYGLAQTRPGGLRFAHDGIPFCLLPGFEDLYDDLKTHRFAVMIEADEDDFVPVDDVAKVHPEPCQGCALRGACPGLYRGYFEARGDAALRPVPVEHRPRANSYHFVPERDVLRPPGAPCPIRRD